MHSALASGSGNAAKTLVPYVGSRGLPAHCNIGGDRKMPCEPSVRRAESPSTTLWLLQLRSSSKLRSAGAEYGWLKRHSLIQAHCSIQYMIRSLVLMDAMNA